MKAKRITLILLSVVMILSTLVVVPVSAEEVAPATPRGYQGFTGREKTGTTDWATVTGEAGSYYIGSDADIEAFAALVSSGTNFDAATVYLTADVTLTKPIGKVGATSSALDSNKYYFAGSFDGQGHTVTLALSESGSEYGGLGMFSATWGQSGNWTVIRNLVIKGSVTQTSTNYAKGGVAAVVGYVYNYTQIDNVLNEADVVAPSTTGKNEYAGGFVGQNGSGNAAATIKITNSTNRGDVSGKRAGGFYGFICGCAENCVNEGAITSYDQFAAGIAGSFRYGGENYIKNCENRGTIVAQGANGSAAGIACGPDNNKAMTMTIENCDNYGAVTAQIYVAGILSGINNAYAGNTVTVTNCNNYGTIKSLGGTHAAGIVLRKTSGLNITLTNCKQYGVLVNGSDEALDNNVANIEAEKMINCEIVLPETEKIALVDLLADPSLYEGTEFSISSADDLKALSTLVNVNNLTFSGKTIKLINDLDMSGITDFVPVGRWAYASDDIAHNTAGSFAFMGTFDGQDYTISNLHVTVTLDEEDEMNAAGNNRAQDALAAVLFARAESATIKSLKVVSSSVTHTTAVNRAFGISYTGGLVACTNKTNVRLEDLELDIDVTGFYHVGGVMGSGPVRGSFTRITRDGLVTHTGTTGYVGGFYAYGAAQINDCVNLGDVYSPLNPNAALFIGANDNNTSMSGCTNYGDLLGMGSAIFVSNTAANASKLATITNCVNKTLRLGDVPFVATSDGTSYDESKATNCSHDLPAVEDMLKVSYQTKAGTKEGTAVRFVTTVDTLGYATVRYTITANGKTAVKENQNVFTSIIADDVTLADPTAIGCETSKYFAAISFDNVTGVDSFTVQVTLVDADGTEYEGGAWTVTLN